MSEIDEISVWNEDLLRSKYPDIHNQLSLIGKGVSRQRALFRSKARRHLFLFRTMQIIIVLSTAVTTLLIANDLKLSALISSTIAAVLTGVSAIFDWKSNYIRTETTRMKLEILYDTIVFSLNKDIDSPDSYEITKYQVSEWRDNLSDILRDAHEQLIEIRSKDINVAHEGKSGE